MEIFVTKEEIELVDEIRRLWFHGEPLDASLVELLKSIPIQIRTLINIIDTMQDKLSAEKNPFYEGPEAGTILN